MTKNEYLTIPAIAKITSKSPATIQRHLEALVLKGKIKREGSRKKGARKIVK